MFFCFEEDNTKKSIDIVKMPPAAIYFLYDVLSVMKYCTAGSSPVQCMICNNDCTVAYFFYLQSRANCEGFLKLLQLVFSSLGMCLW